MSFPCWEEKSNFSLFCDNYTGQCTFFILSNCICAYTSFPTHLPECQIADERLEWESQQLDFQQDFNDLVDYSVFKCAGFHQLTTAFRCQEDYAGPDALLVSNHFMAKIDGERLRTQPVKTERAWTSDFPEPKSLSKLPLFGACHSFFSSNLTSFLLSSFPLL